MPLRAILFDLDGTLRHSVPSGFETFISILHELGYTLDAEQLRAGERWTHYYWSIAPELVQDSQEFGVDKPAFWARYAERQIEALRLGGCPTELAARVSELMTTRYNPVDVVPDDVRPTLLALRARGLKLALVSNRTEPLAPVAEALGLLDLFEFALSAGEVGFWKPAPEIFLHSLKRLGVDPADAVYVGDNYHADVEGARNAGLVPILIDPRRLFIDPCCPAIAAIADLPAALGLSPATIAER
jgi:HAD superfamily hydrolase (TIGR01509 family)